MDGKTYPSFAVAKPEALVVFCGDPRFQAATLSFLAEELGLPPGQYLPFSVAGGIAALTEPLSSPKDFKVLKEGIGFYLEHLRTARRVILISHEDCKKYAHLSQRLPLFFSGVKNMIERQRVDLHKVSTVVSGLVTDPLKVERYFAKFANPEHTEVTFEAI